MKRLATLVSAFLLLGLVCLGTGCSAQAKKERHLKKAESLYQQGSFDRAEIEYMNAARYEPTNATIITRLGLIYAKQGEALRALPLLGMAQALAPTNIEVSLQQALIFQRLASQFENMALQYGDMDMHREALGLRRNVREIAKKVLQQNPRDGEALLLLTGNILGTNELRETESRIAAFRQQNGENSYFQLAAASVMMQEGNRSGAEAAIQRAVTAEPKLYTAHLRAAEVALVRSNLTAAEDEFKKALAMAPARTEASLEYARYKAFSGKTEEALKILKDATDKAPDFTSAWRLMAQFSYQTQKPEDALQYLNRMLFKNPGNYEALHLRAEIQANQKQLAKANSDVEGLINGVNAFAQAWQKRLEAAKTNAPATGKLKTAAEERKTLEMQQAQLRGLRLTFYPQLPGAYLLAAQINNALTNEAKAVEYLNQALSLAPGYVEARILLTQNNLRRGMDPNTALRTMLDYTAVMEKRIEAAEKAYGRTNVVATPVGRRMILQYYQAVAYLAVIYEQLGRWENAAAIYRRVLQDNPQNAAVRLSLGNNLQRQQKFTQARAEYENILKADPGAVPALAQLTMMDLAATNQTAALKRLQPELAKNPQSPQLHYLVGLAYSGSSNTLQQAESALRKCLELDENHTPAYALLGRIYFSKRQMDDAVKQLSASLEKQPGDGITAMLLADVHKSMKNDDKAREVYEKIIAQRPNFVPALNNLAYLYAEKYNEFDKAVEMSRRAHVLAPTNAIIQDTHGWVLFRRGDFGEALALIQDSAQRLAELGEVQYHLGMAYYMTGQPEPARAALQRAVADKEDFPGKEDAKKHLALLQAGPQSLADLEKVVRDNPKDLMAWIRLGEMYQRQNQTKQAADAYEKALAINAKAVTPLIELARLNAGPLNSPEKALEFARKAREQSPSNPQVLHLLGRLSYQAGDTGNAYNMLQDCLRLQPDNIPAVHDFAWAAYAQGKFDEAEQRMQQVTQAAASQPTLANSAKWFLSLWGHYENPQNLASIEAQVNETLKTDPNYVPGLLVVGMLQSQRNQFKEAIQTFEKIIARFPNFPPAHRALAYLYVNDPAQEKRALELAQRARLWFPEDGGLPKIMGRIYFNRKDFVSAVRFLQESLGKAPSDPEALYYLGSSYAQLKDKVRAKDALNKALAAGLKAPLDAEAKRVLQSL